MDGSGSRSTAARQGEHLPRSHKIQSKVDKFLAILIEELNVYRGLPERRPIDALDWVLAFHFDYGVSADSRGAVWRVGGLEMFKRMMLIKKRPDITREEFIKYYEEKHLPLCMSLLPPPRMHRRNYPDPNDALGRAMQASRESGPPPEYDCINEVIHDTREDAEAYFRAISDPNIQALIHADEKNFIAPGGITVYIVEVREQRCP